MHLCYSYNFSVVDFYNFECNDYNLVLFNNVQISANSAGSVVLISVQVDSNRQINRINKSMIHRKSLIFFRCYKKLFRTRITVTNRNITNDEVQNVYTNYGGDRIV